jgi:hypothetical protein
MSNRKNEAAVALRIACENAGVDVGALMSTFILLGMRPEFSALPLEQVTTKAITAVKLYASTGTNLMEALTKGLTELVAEKGSAKAVDVMTLTLDEQCEKAGLTKAAFYEMLYQILAELDTSRISARTLGTCVVLAMCYAGPEGIPVELTLRNMLSAAVLSSKGVAIEHAEARA